MHGHLKVEMIDCETAMIDNPDRFLEGYMEALTNMYCLTYNLTIDRKQFEETLA
jgi:spore coat polysaccharide biosynthesis protein SpsF (cytidylyltransferase family)